MSPKKRFVEKAMDNGQVIVEDTGYVPEETPVEISTEKTVEEKRRYFECYFCKDGTKIYEPNGQDTISHWCKKCGKCIKLDWKE